jgi:5-methylcytosine-specific restriction endonuclease McrA
VIDIDQYRKRVAKLFSNDRDRWRRKLEKGLPKGVKLNLAPDAVLPYTQREFENWLWSKIQLQAILCPYCSAPIDILSMELDHKVPVRRGGDMNFENRECICRRCNQAKQDFTDTEFLLIVEFMRGPGAFFRQRLEGVLISGGVGRMMRHFPKTKKEQPKHTQDALEFSEF